MMHRAALAEIIVPYGDPRGEGPGMPSLHQECWAAMGHAARRCLPPVPLLPCNMLRQPARGTPMHLCTRELA